MSAVIYLIVGGDGEYSGRREGASMAFDSREEADAMLAKLSAIRDEAIVLVNVKRAALGTRLATSSGSFMWPEWHEIVTTTTPQVEALGFSGGLCEDYQIAECPVSPRMAALLMGEAT